MSKLLLHRPESPAYYKRLYLLFKRSKSRFTAELVYIAYFIRNLYKRFLQSYKRKNPGFYFILRRRYKYNNDEKLDSKYHKNAKSSRIKSYTMKFTKQNKL